MGKASEKLKRLDTDKNLRKKILPLCRLRYGQVWADEKNGHKVAVLKAEDSKAIGGLFGKEKASLVINDPPYNVMVGNSNTKALFKTDLAGYMEFSKKWVSNAVAIMAGNSHLYVWLGADYKDNFQPLPDFMVMMRGFDAVKPRNFITMRNQRGYGTQKNWMWVRQELLHYTKGGPYFKVIYSDIPRILKGYYKEINGKVTENSERSRSKFIRPGNVWVDIQQVFYRMEENVAGCYAQKPLKAIERIMASSSREGSLVADFFSHSGTTLLAGERLGRKVYTFDADPVFAELTIRRLEHFRETGKTGWQWNDPFEK
jgi:site-specific DNA-methyltransferase (adenine-specific)